MKNIFKTKHRVVSDIHLGYEVQVKRFVFPFWVQCWKNGCINTFESYESAKSWVDSGKKKAKERIVIGEF